MSHPFILAENPLCNPICGACHYKRFDYKTQIEKKQIWADSQLSLWKNVLHPIRPAPESERLGYRSKSWMKSWTESSIVGDKLSFGMFRSIKIDGEWEKEFISWNTCPIHVPAIQQVVDNLRENLPFFEDLVGVWIGSPHLVIVCRTQNRDWMKHVDWSRILVSPLNRVWFHCNPQVGRKIFGHFPIELVQGPPVSGHPIRAFRQVAQTLLTEARTQAVAALLETKPDLVLDLYCGTGELSVLIPPSVNWVGIEQAKEAVQYSLTLKPDGRTTHMAFVGGIEQRLNDPRVLEQILGRYSLYLNPPRSGLSIEAIDLIRNLISAKRPERIVYLSCSASSLARDLRSFLDLGFEVTRLQPYDFFPQTEHFETLALLKYSAV